MSALPDPSIVRHLLDAGEAPDARPFDLRRLDAEEALAAAPDFASLIALWSGRRAGAAVPDWHDMEFADFRGWHSALLVSDITDGEPDPLFRVIGEDYRIVRDSSLPGQRFSELMPRLYERQFREHFRAIRDQGLLGLAVGPAALVGREHVHLRILELPFRRGGDGVRRLLHALSPTTRGGSAPRPQPRVNSW